MYIYWIQTSNLTGLLFAPFLFRDFINILNVKGFFFLKKKKKQYLKAIAIYTLPLRRKWVEMLSTEMLIGRKKKPP